MERRSWEDIDVPCPATTPVVKFENSKSVRVVQNLRRILRRSTVKRYYVSTRRLSLVVAVCYGVLLLPGSVSAMLSLSQSEVEIIE